MDCPRLKEGHMARKYRMHGLEGIKEDAIELLAVGGGAVVGIAAAKAVTGYIEGMDWAKSAAAAADWKKSAVKFGVPVIPLAVGAAIIFGADKAGLSGNARKAAVGVAAGMAAVSIGKLVVAAVGEDTAKKFYLMGLGASVDSYDTGLLAGLGEMMPNASVSAYMNRFAGSPASADVLLAGAPLVVDDPSQGNIGSPTVAIPLRGLSATLQ